jgi:hypothetical protein
VLAQIDEPDEQRITDAGDEEELQHDRILADHETAPPLLRLSS